MFFKWISFAWALWIQERVQYLICPNKPSLKMPKVSWCIWRNCWNIGNGLIKTLWLCQPKFENCKVWGIWIWWKQFKTHKKLSFPKTTKGKSWSSFIDWLEIILGLPQGSILEPIFFQYFNQLFSWKKQISVTLQMIQFYMLGEKKSMPSPLS